MKIKELTLGIEETKDYGLKKFYSPKFNSVIALVGKNGAGKSRYLKAIENKIKNLDMKTDFEKQFSFSPNDFIQHHKLYLTHQKNYDAYYELIDAQDAVKNNDSKESQTRLNLATSSYNTVATRTRINPREFIKINQNLKTEIEKRIKIINPSDLRRLQASFDNKNQAKTSFQNIIDSTLENIDINEFEMISESALTFLQRLPHKLAYDDIDCRGDEKKIQK